MWDQNVQDRKKLRHDQIMSLGTTQGAVQMLCPLFSPCTIQAIVGSSIFMDDCSTAVGAALEICPPLKCANYS